MPGGARNKPGSRDRLEREMCHDISHAASHHRAAPGHTGACRVITPYAPGPCEVQRLITVARCCQPV